MEINKLLQIRNVIVEHIDDKICAPLAYKLMKYLKTTDAEEEFYHKRTQELIDEYGEKDDSGKVVHNPDGGVNIQKDRIDECKKKIEELGATNVDSPDVKFSMNEIAELKLSVKEMYILDDLITP